MTSNRPAPGRLPASVYRRRRLMVLLGLVAVIVAIVLVIVRPGASQGDEVSQTTLPSASPSPAASGAPAAEAPSSESPAPAAPEEPAEDGADCTDGQVVVEAVTDAEVYAAGEQPKLSVTIINTGSNTCVLNAGTAAQVFTISSGNDVYWRSTDCQVDAVDAEVSLEPNTPISSSEPIVWDRTRSTPDTCGDARSAVPGGGASYHLSVSVSGFESTTSKQFLLY
ncbi:hypothetical protein ACFPER_01520 [Agromyces aurantiacus]|uniref:DUF4232 domain-containing protein n=1 Tax=Agromyces aurantiacus TaxID=165814 RepID=A0ABV9R558_9MICO|nr:hypothetical protein [Agromyces aurantiacus]MBM7505766.1 hypothetical protein [Agromyces aurantiacus]